MTPVYDESASGELLGGINTYTYVGGNPLSATDPLGLCPMCAAGGAAGAGSGFGGLGGLGGFGANSGGRRQGDDGSVGGLFPPGTMSSSNSSSSSSSSSSSDTYDNSGQKVCPASPKPPGNCSENEQKQMQEEVDQACSQPRACRPGMDQITIQINISNGMRCALARNAINNKCFAGGDLAHRNEAIRVWNTVAQCQGMAR